MKKFQSLKHLKIFFILALSSLFAEAQINDNQIYKTADSLINLMTIEEKINMIGGHNYMYTFGVKRLGIPELRMADGPVGTRDAQPTIAYPATICLAASWNKELAFNYGKSIGSDAKNIGVHYLLAPGMNIYRSPTCGRNFEYLGEDPYLVAKMASNYAKGVQSVGVIATAKHFIANNQEYDRNHTSSDIDERTLNEIYFPAFKACVKEANIGAIMIGYNLLNNVHCAENEYLINKTLKKDWGFKGIVMSDWNSVYSSVPTANAGLDIEMPNAKFLNKENLLPAIEKGTLTEKTINDKIRRQLYNMIRFGFLKNPNGSESIDYDSTKSFSTSLEIIREGAVLLKNKNNTLPLNKKKNKKIVVIGPNSHPAIIGGGGSSHMYPTRATSVSDGIKSIVGKSVNVHSTKGVFGAEKEYITNVDFSSIDKNGKKIKGLKAEYFPNMDLEGKPTQKWIDTILNLNFSNPITDGLKKDSFSVRWTGKVNIPKNGKYNFFGKGDDGFRIYINGKKICERWWKYEEKFGFETIELSKGEHDITFEYFQYRWGARIGFGYVSEEYLENKKKKDEEEIKNADVIILCIGFNEKTEGEAGERGFYLAPEHIKLLERVHELNSNIIVVLTAGGNVEMTEWLDKPKALIHSWYGGQEGGQAIAEIIFGEINPSGKLPASFEVKWDDSPSRSSYYDDDKDKRVFYSEGIFTGHRHFDKHNIKPIFPFGYGLSYTSFKYSDIQLSKNTINSKDSIIVSFSLKNTGKYKGKEIAQLYISDLKSSVPRPIKELKGFSKTELKPGKSKKVTLTIKPEDLMFYDMNKHKWILEPGQFKVYIGSSSTKMELEAKFSVKH